MDREDEPDFRLMSTTNDPLSITAASIDVSNVAKSYGASRAVDNVSFTVKQGEVLSLLGPSGCGKTTIMRMIAGLITPDAGDIRIQNRSMNGVPVHRRNVGMLFQNYALFPHLTIAGNVAFGLEMRRFSKGEVYKRVLATLDMVRLGPMAERFPHQLSGGQQQRVALARALIVEPSVLLLDEPFGALDKKLREEMQFETRQLQQRLGITTLMVTHDQEEALTLSDNIVVMRDGKIEQFGTPATIYERPKSRFVAGFIGTANFFDCEVTRSTAGSSMVTGDDGTTMTLDENRPLVAALAVAVRPERIRITGAGAAAEPNSLRATVEQVVYHGINSRVHLRRQDGSPMLVVVPYSNIDSAMKLISGSVVQLAWSPKDNIVIQD
jgi:putative spermidine/putrescine transport system ATP-binding protein